MYEKGYELHKACLTVFVIQKCSMTNWHWSLFRKKTLRFLVVDCTVFASYTLQIVTFFSYFEHRVHYLLVSPVSPSDSCH